MSVTMPIFRGLVDQTRECGVLLSLEHPHSKPPIATPKISISHSPSLHVKTQSFFLNGFWFISIPFFCDFLHLFSSCFWYESPGNDCSCILFMFFSPALLIFFRFFPFSIPMDVLFFPLGVDVFFSLSFYRFSPFFPVFDPMTDVLSSH